MLRPFLRAGVFPAHDPTAIPPATAPLAGTGTLTASGVGGHTAASAAPHFGGTGGLSASGFATSSGGGGGGGGTGTTVKYSADFVIQHVGIDTHWRYTTWGPQTSMLIQRVLDLGIMHIRDGLGNSGTVPSAFQTLASHGVKSTVIVANPTSSVTGVYTQSQLPTAIALVKSTLGGSLEYVEGPNEWDLHGTMTELVNYMAVFYPMIRNDSWFANIPVKGPSMAYRTSYASYLQANGGVVDPHTDGGTMHSYDYHMPENGIVDDWCVKCKAAFGSNKPLYVTEFGYYNSSAGSNWVDQPTAADYLIRSIMQNITLGIKNATQYELWDDPGPGGAESSYGLVTSGGTLKPAGIAVQNLLARMRDTGTNPVITAFPISWTSSDTSVHVVLFGRKDNAIDVAVWRAQSLWNETTKTPQTVSPVAVNFTLGVAKSAVAFRLKTGVSTTLVSNSTNFTVQANGDVQLVRIS